MVAIVGSERYHSMYCISSTICWGQQGGREGSAGRGGRGQQQRGGGGQKGEEVHEEV